ncbi:MAG: hypothetical protein ACI97A_002474 [Planctomycetota bacterium]|jgi:hypothetical protein
MTVVNLEVEEKKMPRHILLLGLGLFALSALTAQTWAQEEAARKTAKYDSTFLQRRQCEELLSRFKGIESVEIVETRKTKVGRDGAEVTSQSKIEVAGSEEAKANAQQFLAQWARLDHKVISLNFYLIETETRQPTLLSHSFQAISDQELEIALKRHRKNTGSVILSMPKVVVIHGQSATVSMLNEVAYVKDFDVEVASAALIADPVIDLIREGVEIATTPVIDVDGEGLTLKVDARISSIQRPIPEFTTEVIPGGGSKVTIQLPQVYFNSKKTDSLRLSSGQMSFRVLGLRTLKGEDGEKTVHYELLGTAKIID